MQNKTKINLSLFLFAFGAVFSLFRFTNFGESGLGKYLENNLESLRRIISEKPQESALTESEKGDIEKIVEKNIKPQEYFCKSSFFPFLPGAKWEYSISSGDSKDIITYGIPEPENNINFLDSSILSKKDWTVRTLFVCENEKIKLTDLNFLLTASKSGFLGEPCEEKKFDFFLPSNQTLLSNSSFEENGCLNYKSNENLENQNLNFKETIFSKWRIFGDENIEVPAGKFFSKRIEITFNFRQEFDKGAQSNESKVTLWVSEGVGIVKILSQTQDNSVTPAKSTTIIQELKSFQIPTEIGNKVRN